MPMEDEQRMFSDLGVVCWEGQHIKHIYQTVLPALIIVVIGFPLMAYILMVRNIEKLQLVEQLHNLP
jgi:hypothetical protein